MYAPEKPIAFIPAWTILPALDHLARPRRDSILVEILRLEHQHFR